MKKIGLSKYVAAAALALGGLTTALVSTADAQNYGGPYTYNGYIPALVITYNGGTSFTVVNNGDGPYDGADDTWIGVHNASSVSLPEIYVTSDLDILGFDGDGIDSGEYGPIANPSSVYGYEGPNMTYQNLTYGPGPQESLDVVFTGGLAAGGYTYFSLEESIAGVSGGFTVGNVPDTGSSMALLSASLIGLGALRRRFKL